jgi:hypothetical protein
LGILNGKGVDYPVYAAIPLKRRMLFEDDDSDSAPEGIGTRDPLLDKELPNYSV